MLPLRTLPIVENWDCQSCGVCCHGSTIILDQHDLNVLRDQHWEQHDEFRKTRTVVRSSLLGGKHVLAKNSQGNCVFLTAAGRCRIHELHGESAKPSVCRMFPLQVVNLENSTALTVRRSCPTAAAGQGKELKDHITFLRKSGLAERFSKENSTPPPIVGRTSLEWRRWNQVADALTSLMTDERLPLVRRLVHGLRFCSSLERCKLPRVEEDEFGELLSLLKESAPEEVGGLFRERVPPTAATRFVFRQAAVHYIRSHPRFPINDSWKQKLKLLWTSTMFARGKGMTPKLHPEFTSISFAQIEEPLGALDADTRYPLEQYFEAHVISRRYALVGHRRALIASYRALALEFSMAFFLLRLVTVDREPTRDDMVDVVTTLDRGHGTAAICKIAGLLANSDQLERSIAWYVR